MSNSTDDLEPRDYDISEFVENIFKHEPLDPFAIENVIMMENGSTLTQVLGHFVVRGARILYNKELAHLSEAEIFKVRSYLLSIGWDVEYEIVKETKSVKDYNPDGTEFIREIPINNWKIQFKRADNSLRPSSGCGDKLV